MQHGLRGDTADVQAGASQILLFNDGGLRAQLRSANGGNIAARTRANYNDIIMCVCHYMYSPTKISVTVFSCLSRSRTVENGSNMHVYCITWIEETRAENSYSRE